MIILDTSILVEGLSREGEVRTSIRATLAARHRMAMPTPVLYEWLRGPRVKAELALQEALVPAEEALPFTDAEAAVAARLYKTVVRPRGREMDLAIAAFALTWQAQLWTLNEGDFTDLPDLSLFRPPA
ncbi:MAG: type II toxin-antitoxin system VapC family toxin [Gemmatimonadetes bacterium]|nr:type II toxin-antitoxin system VapC family toxin [Gemmatimonadota bacterium]